MASALDPQLAPPGKHVIHAYTAGNEPWDVWAGVERGTPEYEKLKEERSAVLWAAIEKYIPDARKHVEIEMVGTPRTHARFLNRDRGTYGPAVRAGKSLLPQQTTPIKRLLRCGDSTNPGIGVPTVACSGAIAANAIIGLRAHLRNLDKVMIESR